MAEAIGMTKNRDLGRFLDVADKFVGASGDDEIDMTVLGEKLGDGIASGDELDGRVGNLGLF